MDCPDSSLCAGQPGSFDEERLSNLEKFVNDTQDSVEHKLTPKLKELEEKDARQKNLISQMDSDIDRILKDIKNVEDIYATLPKGCFNLPPVESPWDPKDRPTTTTTLSTLRYPDSSQTTVLQETLATQPLSAWRQTLCTKDMKLSSVVQPFFLTA